MAPRNITNNFLVGNYGGTNGPIDNDDGSIYYRNNHNFEVYGHQKFKVGNIESYGNVMAYVSDFGGKVRLSLFTHTPTHTLSCYLAISLSLSFTLCSLLSLRSLSVSPRLARTYPHSLTLSLSRLKWSAFGDIAAHPHQMHDNYVVFNPEGSQQYHDQEAWNATNNKLYGVKVTLPVHGHSGKPISLEECVIYLFCSMSEYFANIMLLLNDYYVIGGRQWIRRIMTLGAPTPRRFRRGQRLSRKPRSFCKVNTRNS